jgi:hypothetical protein
MPRTNKVTARVFTDLSKVSIEEFLNVDKELELRITPEIQAMKKSYEALAKESDFIEVLDNLASIEEIIIQMRCKQVIKSELRLSLSRNYIYARSLFYRRGKEINDIRVVVGLTVDHGDDLSELIKDQIFRDVCTSTLLGAMVREIEKNIFNLKHVYANE